MLKLHYELLNKEQIEVLEILKNFSKYGSIGGGTALMLQFSHRYSYDLDIFLPKLVSKKFLYKVKQYFERIEIIVDTGDEFSFVSAPHGVKISFIYYPFSPLYKTIPTPYLRFFSWKDIALDKSHTIGRRGEWRDYVDLYFAIKNGFPLENIIKGAQKKFGDSFSEKLFLSQLIYYGDLKDFTIEFIEKKHSSKEIQKFLAKEIEKYKKEIL
ncbi:MAG: nucleotidyl transferase AbiEii/AbiGii toxin family protein [Candidatus Nealsonbacteria bacterium]